jgi:hypothetical protein
VSRLRAAGAITNDSTSTVIKLGDEHFQVDLVLRRFPNGGSWSLFLCPQCSRRTSILRLLEGQAICVRCGFARGVRYRCEPMSVRRRSELSVARHRARLEAGKSERQHPRPGRGLERRECIVNSLLLAELTLRRHRLESLKSALAAAKKDE